MREFIEALFEKENKIEFQYEDYEMSFFAGRFKSYYLIFYIRTQAELIDLWKNTSSIFKTIKQNEDIYRGIIRMCEQVAASGNTLILYSA